MTPDYFLSNFWIGWKRWAVWSVCLLMIITVGMLRAKTDVELTSLALIPVLIISWIGGQWNGLVMSLLSVGLWLIGDFSKMQFHNNSWIIWMNATTRFITYGLVAYLIAKIQRQFVSAFQLASLDPLTGLHNRRSFLNFGLSEVSRSIRYSHSLAIAFLDLDNFKKLNDSKGHDVGDVALQAIAKTLTENLRANDRITRLGGDEFAILLPEIQYEEAIEVGHKISNTVNTVLYDFPPVTGSIGIAWFGVADRTFHEMLKVADQLMYEVKASGKGNFRCQNITLKTDSKKSSDS